MKKEKKEKKLSLFEACEEKRMQKAVKQDSRYILLYTLFKVTCNLFIDFSFYIDIALGKQPAFNRNNRDSVAAFGNNVHQLSSLWEDLIVFAFSKEFFFFIEKYLLHLYLDAI